MIEENREIIPLGSGEMGLLDLLVTMAENLKLLVFGPVAAGLLALGICYVVPQTFASESIVALPNATSIETAQAAAVMTSPIVLDSVIKLLNLAEGRTTQIARKKLVNQVKATLGKDGLLRLDTTANTPADAQNIANAVLSAWLVITVPGVEERADLEKRLESAKSFLDAVERVLKKLTVEEGSSNLSQPLTRGEPGTSIVAIGELQTRFLSDVLRIPRQLKGYSRDVIRQPPTLPTEPVSPKKGLVAILAAVLSGFALLLWVFIREAWRLAIQDPDKAEKQKRLKAALGLKVG